jgi:hypothetical protein
MLNAAKHDVWLLPSTIARSALMSRFDAAAEIYDCFSRSQWLRVRIGCGSSLRDQQVDSVSFVDYPPTAAKGC